MKYGDVTIKHTWGIMRYYWDFSAQIIILQGWSAWCLLAITSLGYIDKYDKLLFFTHSIPLKMDKTWILL